MPCKTLSTTSLAGAGAGPGVTGVGAEAARTIVGTGAAVAVTGTALAHQQSTSTQVAVVSATAERKATFGAIVAANLPYLRHVRIRGSAQPGDQLQDAIATLSLLNQSRSDGLRGLRPRHISERLQLTEDQVASILTTTGFGTATFAEWPLHIPLILVMLIGSAAYTFWRKDFGAIHRPQAK